MILIVFCFAATAQAADIDLAAVRQIESSGNPRAVSFLGAQFGRGWYQISEVALRDYNERTGSSIAPDELFDAATNERVARWMLIVRIPQMLRHYGIADTVDNRLFAFNCGIGHVVKGTQIDARDRYLAKYYRAERK